MLSLGTLIIAKECSIFIMFCDSASNPSGDLKIAETLLGIHFSHKQITSTFVVVIHVGRSAVL